MSKKHAMFGAALGLSALSLLSKLLGFVREQAIAWRFGASAAVDTYVAALVVPQLLAGIIGGAIATSFLPVYSTERESGRGRNVAATSFLATIILSALGSVIAIIFAAPIVRGLVGNFSLEQQALTVSLLRIMAFGTLLMSVSFFLTILFNGHRSFVLPALNPVVQNVVIVVGLLALGSLGISGLAWSTLVGMAIPVVALLAVALYKGLPITGFSRFNDPAFIRVLQLSAPIFISSLIGQLYMVVDRRLASGLDAGSLASLNFANKLVQLPVGIFVTALATVVYPTLAEFAAKGDKKGFAEATLTSLRGLVLLLLPASVGLYVLRYPIVRLAFERGSFDEVATTRTAFAVGYYAIGLLGVSVAQVLARAFYSLQDTITPVKVGIITAFVNIGLALALVQPLGHGGLALANSLGLTFNAVMLLYLLAQKLKSGTFNLVAPLLGKSALAALLMGVASSLVLTDRKSVV